LISFGRQMTVFSVIRHRRLVLAICMWGCLQAQSVFACRYNVRETGFVDLGVEPYFLYGFVGQDTSADVVSSFKEISDANLIDSNIRVEIIDTVQQKNHPAIKLLDKWALRELPAAVLVSPDGQSLPVALRAPGKSLKEVLLSELDGILSSPKREEIIQEVIKAYGMVLLIKGPNAEENDKAKQECAAAIEQVSDEIGMMPKPIAHPPVLITLDSESFSKEKVLLWSLGLEAKKITEPHAVVLYGKARWIGPLFKGEEITEYNLASVLFVVGADCECGFDYRWLQGTMLPARWDEKRQAQIAENLGFDPENPMIKSEMSWIIGRGYSSYPRTPFGYQELVIEPESPNDVNETLPDPVDHAAAPEPNTAEPVSAPEPLAESAFRLADSLRYVMYILIGLSALILVAGVVVLVRAKRK
jgi:hypothetical protein